MLLIPIEYVLLGVSIILILSIVSTKASGWLGVPGLLVFLLIGMLAGSEGPGGIYFDDVGLAQSLGVVALALILFAGGIDTEWADVRPVMGKAFTLSTAGVALTALLVGLFSVYVLDFSLLQGLLLGSIVSSTDAAAVFSVLRSKNTRLTGGIKPLLEMESGSNDPMAVFLTLGMIQLLNSPDASWFELIPEFALEMAVGGALGYGMGKAMTFLVNRLQLNLEGLYPALTLSLVLLTYGLSVTLGGNGFLAVYVAGIVMGNADFIHKRPVISFHDGLSSIMQIAMFVTLGLLVFPSDLVPIMGIGLLVSLFLMFVARPISVFIALAFFKMRFRERVMTAWVGLRGSVPIILATFPLLADVPNATMIFNLVFFIVFTSVLFQGTSIPMVARWLGVSGAAAPARPKYLLGFGPPAGSKRELVEMVVPHRSRAVGRPIVELGFPKGALIVLIHKEEESVVPNGGTILDAGDTMMLLAAKDTLGQVRAILEKPRTTGTTGNPGRANKEGQKSKEPE